MSQAPDSIIIPDVGTAKTVLAEGYSPNKPVQINENEAPVTRVRNPVKRIIAMHQYVVFELTTATERYPSRRQPVHYTEMIKRLKAVNRRHKFEDGGKPKDEIEYERWLVEWSIKAVAQCAANAGKPFNSPALNAMLRAMDIRMNRIKNNII